MARYLVLVAAIVLALAAVAGLAVFGGWGFGLAAAGFGILSAVGINDVVQTRQSIRRNYPILSHFRFLFEEIRPEIRQYFLENDTEEIPFSRQQRAIVYQRAKNAVDKRAFGTQIDVYAPQYQPLGCANRDQKS
jgi:glutamate synthase domain-containing protein 2